MDCHRPRPMSAHPVVDDPVAGAGSAPPPCSSARSAPVTTVSGCSLLSVRAGSASNGSSIPIASSSRPACRRGRQVSPGVGGSDGCSLPGGRLSCPGRAASRRCRRSLPAGRTGRTTRSSRSPPSCRRGHDERCARGAAAFGRRQPQPYIATIEISAASTTGSFAPAAPSAPAASLSASRVRPACLKDRQRSGFQERRVALQQADGTVHAVGVHAHGEQLVAHTGGRKVAGLRGVEVPHGVGEHGRARIDPLQLADEALVHGRIIANRHRCRVRGLARPAGARLPGRRPA